MKPKTKKVKLPKVNQLENLKAWLAYYADNGKLPYDELFCASCKKKEVKVGKAKLASLLEDMKIDKAITTCLCKTCKAFARSNAKILEKKNADPDAPKEPPKPPRILTMDEIEDHKEEIRRELPKVDVTRPIRTINLLKNREACERETKDVCVRPDIFLRNRDCDNCKLNKWCICPIKKFSKYYKE